MSRRAHRRVLLVLLLAVVLVDLAVVAFVMYPDEAAWLKLYFSVKRNGCSPADALGAVRYHVRQRRLATELKAATRVIRSTPDNYSLLRTPSGEFWAPTSQINSALFVLAETELEPYADKEVAVRPGDIVLDCGAHVGLVTRQSLKAGAQLVVAIEPGTRQQECLRRTFASEVSSGRVRICPKAVWDKTTELLFEDDGADRDKLAAAGAAHATLKVATVTIDELVEELHLERVDFIKMDIEGAEQEALAGATRTLARFRPRLAIAGYHKANDSREIPRLIQAANSGYKAGSSGGCRIDLAGEARPRTLYFY